VPSAAADASRPELQLQPVARPADVPHSAVTQTALPMPEDFPDAAPDRAQRPAPEPRLDGLPVHQGVEAVEKIVARGGAQKTVRQIQLASGAWAHVPQTLNPPLRSKRLHRSHLINS
jgi:hypothetical protein